MARTPIDQALKGLMLEQKSKRAWAGDPDLLLGAYKVSGGKIVHPENRVKAVLSALRKSALFQQPGYIRASDRTGRREVLHAFFTLVPDQSQNDRPTD